MRGREKRKREDDLEPEPEHLSELEGETKARKAHEEAKKLTKTKDHPPTINPGAGESVFGVPQVGPPQVDPVTQAFNDLRDSLGELPPDDILELQAEDPDAVPNPFGDVGGALKAKRSKKRKKKRKSKYRKSKHIKSKRRKSKRKKKKRKHH
tara:strand:+ start:362 stop:817 length:456 start_codon:yes stop_codon:yes gene_type:complete